MIATKQFVGFAMVLALVPAMAGAQQHDMSKMGKDTTKKAPMAGMKHDMAGMKMDTGKMAGTKHDMSKMGQMDMKSGWAELDAFHTLLMAIWHPAQKDTLGPARTMAPTLATSAEAWATSKGPAKCDNAAARKVLSGIVADVKVFGNAVARKATDGDVKAALKKVHDGFEKVAMPCMMGEMKGMGMGMGMGAGAGMKHEQMTSGWRELDALHSLLMTVSMAAQKNDLESARAKATEVVAGAEELAKSKGPATCDNEAARKLMPAVVSGAKAYGDVVAKNAADAEVKLALQKFHDEFKQMAMPCMMAGVKDMKEMKH